MLRKILSLVVVGFASIATLLATGALEIIGSLIVLFAVAGFADQVWSE